MEVTTLIENTSLSEDLIQEHGLSLLIETGDLKILFDSGQSGKFVDNAKKLGVDLDQINFVVLSHGHYDHGGGLERLFIENTKAKVYLNKNTFKDDYHKSKYIGLDKELLNSDRLIFCDDKVELSKNIKLQTCNNLDLKEPLNSFNLYIKEDGQLKEDHFLHEQYLEIIEDGKKILFSGCSHKGILNITNWFTPDILIGGFHLMEVPVEEGGIKYLDEIAKELLSYPTQYFTCHCTGKKQFKYLKKIMGPKLSYLAAGSKIKI